MEEKHAGIDNLIAKLSESFNGANVVMKQNDSNLVPSEESTAYKPALTIYKDGELVMVAAEAEADDNKSLANLWYYCNQAKYFLIISEQKLNLFDVPYSVTIDSPRQEGCCLYFNTYTKYSLNMDDLKSRKVEIGEIISIVKEFKAKTYQSISISEFQQAIKDLTSYKGVEKEIGTFFLDIPPETSSFDFDNDKCSLTPRMERKLMKSLLGSVPSGSSLYRYTSYHSLKRIFENRNHSMASLATMNDTTEVDYARNYLIQHGVNDSLLTSIQDSVYTYITSLSEMRDDLIMWRLYGDDTRGVSIEYATPTSLSDDFLMANVSYADEQGNNSKLNFIAELMRSKVGTRAFQLRQWNLWQHFFKPYEYRKEKEIRLLLFSDNLTNTLFKNCEIKWIQTNSNIWAPIATIPLSNYPLKVRGILLGNKFPQVIINSLTLTAYIQEIRDRCDEKYEEFEGFFTPDFNLGISNVNNYR